MDKFKGLDKRAQEGSQDTALDCTHQNAITQIFPHSGPRENLSKFSTSGVDGRLVIWNCRSLESSIAGLSIRWGMPLEMNFDSWENCSSVC